MLIIPAIDIMSGKVVRLARGDFEKGTVYEGSPVDFALKWQSEGARVLHVVDLDGAKCGEPKNFETVRAIADAVDIEVEVGGGIRKVENVRRYLAAGLDRVVLSTKIIEDASFLLSRDIKPYLNSVAVSLDIRRLEMAGLASSATAGWLESEDVLIDIRSLIAAVTAAGVRMINFSDISKDGMLAGLDMVKIQGFLKLARSTAQQKLFFTYAGGIATLADLKMLKLMGEEAVDGVIVGRALYENKFSLKDAIDTVA